MKDKKQTAMPETLPQFSVPLYLEQLWELDEFIKQCQDSKTQELLTAWKAKVAGDRPPTKPVNG